MIRNKTFLLLFLLTVSSVTSTPAQDVFHTWTDASGNYRIQAGFIARNDSSVVLQMADKSMLIVEIEQLSNVDRQYLADLENARDEAMAAEIADANNPSQSTLQSDDSETGSVEETGSQIQCWRLADLNVVCGEVVEYGRRLVEIKKRSNRVYVNDRLFKNLPAFYQKVTIAMVNRFEDFDDETIDNEDQLRRWLASRPKRQSAYTVDGVIIENSRGDLYSVPFFMFDERDVDYFLAGWEAWQAAEEDAKRQAEMSLSLRVESVMRQRKEQSELNLRRLHLSLEGQNAGLFDLWQVDLYPPRNSNALPARIIVPANDSQQATQEARRRYPNMRVGAASRVSR